MCCNRCALSLLLAAVAGWLAASTVPALAEPPKVFPGEYVVTLPSSQGHAGAFSLAASPSFSSRVGDVVEVINAKTLKVSVAEPQGAARALDSDSGGAIPYDPQQDRCKEILAEGLAETCSPNYLLKASELMPNDPSFGQLWGMSDAQGISAPRAWSSFVGAYAVVVAVIDTGIDYNHPDLVANMWRNPGESAGNGVDDDGNGYVDDVHGINAITSAANPGNPMDDHFHGTHVAGTLGAVGNNSRGVAGVNHRVKIMAVKFLSSNGSGSLSDAVRGIDYMTMMRNSYGINIRVANNSWGGGGYSGALEQAIARARDAGIVFVAAAGNDGIDTDASSSYPSGYEVDNVVSVAAIDRNQNLAKFSNYGATTVDIAAPGVDILSTAPGGGYQKLSGTSMATPHVSGALALLLGRNPGLSYLQAINTMYLSGRYRASLVETSGGLPLVRTQRVINAGRMMFNETVPLPTPPAALQPCGYDFRASNLLTSGTVDTSADNGLLVNQSDEGNFYKVDLPFSFPYFRESVNAIWVSPNGLVYMQQPSLIDYQHGIRAPKNSIAVLQTDLVPRDTTQGVRVAVGADKVTVMWRTEHYSYPGQGVIVARLTLNSSGVIATSLHFGDDGNLSDLRAKVLGDPFAAPAVEPMALMGLSGLASMFSSTVDLATSQRALISAAQEPLALGVEMTTNCKTIPPTDRGDREGPVVSWITIFKEPKRRKEIPINVVFGATGTGAIPVRFSINNVACRRTIKVPLRSGIGRMTARIPRGVQSFGVSSGAVSKKTAFASNPPGRTKYTNRELCELTLQTIAK